jgi:hypothetical protein
MFAKHETVNHGIGEYVRGEAHTNTIERYFAILKRGITGVITMCPSSIWSGIWASSTPATMSGWR